MFSKGGSLAFYSAAEFCDIVRAVISQLAAFKIAPCVFVGIEFGSIGGQEFNMEAGMVCPKCLDLLAAMRIEAIPNHENLAT